MPVVIDGGRVPTRWSERVAWRKCSYAAPRTQCLHVALVNNMPDAALEDTEMQFFELLDAASGQMPLKVRLYSLPELPRGERAQQHLSDFYFPFDDLLKSRFDAVIVTGTEPRQSDLRAEPYWKPLTDVLDWASENTISTAVSCLAAHASVLHNDGIGRHPLSDKRCGVFEMRRFVDHAITSHLPELIRVPHSRWNELREDALTSCGYRVLSRSSDAGVDIFIKKIRQSLFVHFQGHPEYGTHALLKEYRRDVRRYLRHEREGYPTAPHGYFNAITAKPFMDFRVNALVDRREELMQGFPEITSAGAIHNTWSSTASSLYRNWLTHILLQKQESAKSAAAPQVGRPYLVGKSSLRKSSLAS